MSRLDIALAAHEAANGARVALDFGDGARVTYAELPAAVAEVATDLGVLDRARPVALAGDYGRGLVLAELALLGAGVPVLSLPRFFTEAQSGHAIAASGAQPMPGGASAALPPQVLLPSGTARISFTSGSSGTPKGICLTADHLLDVAAAVVTGVGSRHAGRHLALLPPGILLETVAGMYATLLAGGTYVCPPQASVGLGDPFRPDVAAMFTAIDRMDITSLILVPEYLAGLVTLMERTGVRLPALTIVAVGGARVPPALLARALAVGLPVRQGYGLTETGSVVALEASVDPMAAGSVGGSLGLYRISLAGDGEILLDGPVCAGVIGGEAPTRPFATGDIGRVDGEGRLWIEGRKSNLIVTSFGRNISPEWPEAVLMSQPGVLQAMVWGDGLPAVQALLVPGRPDVDLAAAVAAANATLPAYARIGGWREVGAFMPGNGQLSGNGKLRRAAIRAVWCAGEPAFADELDAATFRNRLRFLGTPQVQAGLSGTISRAMYIAYLTQAYHHVRHTVPLMEAARARLGHRPELVAALDDYIAEETGHEHWILSDIAAAGGDAAAAARDSAADPATLAMVAHAYAMIAEGNPAAFFGMVFVLESISVALAQRGAGAVAERLGLPPEAFTHLTSHGALDADHMVFFTDLVNRHTTADDRAAITTMARAMFGLFAGVFASIPMEPEHAHA